MVNIARETIEILLVMIITATLAYAFGFPMLFMHSVVEVFYYLGLFAGAIILYKAIKSLFIAVEDVPTQPQGTQLATNPVAKSS